MSLVYGGIQNSKVSTDDIYRLVLGPCRLIFEGIKYGRCTTSVHLCSAAKFSEFTAIFHEYEGTENLLTVNSKNGGRFEKLSKNLLHKQNYGI